MSRSGWPPSPTRRAPFPLTDLAHRLGLQPTDTHALATRLGIDRRWIRRYRTAGLTPDQADTWAQRAGLHPLEVWPDYYERCQLAGVAARNAAKTTCPAGHPYDATDIRGRRICTRCRIVSKRRITANVQVTAVAPITHPHAPHPPRIILHMPERDLLRPQETADRLLVSPTTLERWRAMGVGPPWIKVGRLIRYRTIDVEGYLTRRRVDTRDTAS